MRTPATRCPRRSSRSRRCGVPKRSACPRCPSTKASRSVPPPREGPRPRRRRVPGVGCAATCVPGRRADARCPLAVLAGCDHWPAGRRRIRLGPVRRCGGRRRPRSKTHRPPAEAPFRVHVSAGRLPPSPDGWGRAPPMARSTRAEGAPRCRRCPAVCPRRPSASRRHSFPNRPFSRGLQTFPRGAPGLYVSREG